MGNLPLLWRACKNWNRKSAPCSVCSSCPHSIRLSRPMHEWHTTLALFLLLNLVAGLARVWRGPTPADRMLAAQLFGTTGVAILLLLAEGSSVPALRDVALALALLATLATVVFVRRVWSLQSTTGERRHGDQ